MGPKTAATTRRRRTTASLAGLTVGAVVVLAGVVWLTGTSSPPGRPATAAAHAPSTPPTTQSTTTTTIDPGTLPQTSQLPSSSDPQFQQGVDGLWQAIVSGDPAPAMGFFFPLSAYLQVKAISDPTTDWHERLIADFDQDIATLHARLGAAAPTAQLVGVTVPSDAVWVRPGVEYNKGSYWRVYDAVVRYDAAGAEHSFAIASMISWRGEWYVVHLLSIR